MKTHLLIIDPQNDFCHCTGSLFVPGADKDMERLAKLIEGTQDKIDEIVVSLDLHNVFDISHPRWFIDEEGNPPKPFTQISAEDLATGKYKAHNRFQNQAQQYLEKLEELGRYKHTIWPEHCIFGTGGAAIAECLKIQLVKWSSSQDKKVQYIKKGMDPFTEHFSAVKPEVPSERMEKEQAENKKILLKTISEADTILLAGEASSHCVANTALDLFEEYGDMHIMDKLILINDATSPVPGFEHLEKDFIDRLSKVGLRQKTTIDILEELKCSK